MLPGLGFVPSQTVTFTVHVRRETRRTSRRRYRHRTCHFDQPRKPSHPLHFSSPSTYTYSSRLLHSEPYTSQAPPDFYTPRFYARTLSKATNFQSIHLLFTEHPASITDVVELIASNPSICMIISNAAIAKHTRSSRRMRAGGRLRCFGLSWMSTGLGAQEDSALETSQLEADLDDPSHLGTKPRGHRWCSRRPAIHHKGA